jgi:hypothetical protein
MIIYCFIFSPLLKLIELVHRIAGTHTKMELAWQKERDSQK